MTVNLKLGEPLIEAAKAKLQDNMAARIAEINAEAGGDLPLLDPPLQVPSDYFTAPFDAYPGTGKPLIVLAQGAWELDPDTEGPHSLMTKTELNVYVIEHDTDRQNLAKRLQRQTRAVVESLWDGEPKQKLNKADGTLLAWNLIPLRGVPSPVFDTDKPNTWRQWMLTSFAISQLEA